MGNIFNKNYNIEMNENLISKKKIKIRVEIHCFQRTSRMELPTWHTGYAQKNVRKAVVTRGRQLLQARVEPKNATFVYFAVDKKFARTRHLNIFIPLSRRNGTLQKI